MDFLTEELTYESLGTAPKSPGKTITIYRNGNIKSVIHLKMKEHHDPQDIVKTIMDKFKFKPENKLRLFTSEGLEIYPADMKYLKSDCSIFVSKGENFDKSSTLSEYLIMRKLGEGSFGEVSLAVHKMNKQMVAIKFLKKPATVDAFGLDRFFSEAETLKHLHHKNIVEIINCFTLKDMQVAFVMEYLEGGTLLEYVQNKRRLAEDEARIFFSQIVDAISHCHANKVIHCDLKLENILLKSKDSLDIKIIDFGIAGLKTHFKSDVDGGSLHHMAPEVLSRKKKDLHSGIDIWAMGCILYEMLCGKWAFVGEDKKKMIENICKGKFSFGEYKAELTYEAKHLIMKMLEPDQSKRITMYGILSHPWMNKVKPVNNENARGRLEITSLIKNECG